MNQQNLKLYYILPAAVLVIIIAIVLLLPKKSNPPQGGPAPTVSLPTLYPTEHTPPPVSTSSRPQSNITPTLIPPNFTGAEEKQDIPQSETDLAVQKAELRKKLPLTQPAFTITFDYGNDQFVVTLNEPKEASKTQFNQWLQTNYPSIPLDRFTFK